VGYEELTRHLLRTAETRRDGILARARDEGREDHGRGPEESGDRRAGRPGRRGPGRRRGCRLLRMTRARQKANEMRLRARAAVADAVLAGWKERLPLLLGEARYRASRNGCTGRSSRNSRMGTSSSRGRGHRAALARSDSERAHPLRTVAGNGDRGGGGVGRRRHVPRSEHAPFPVRESRPSLMVELWRRLPGPDE